MAEWRFQDPPNVAIITVRQIVWEGDWIAYVTHDEEDGGWQFHNSSPEPPKAGDAMVLGLGEIVEIDPSITELADLPLGWHAWRESKGAPWRRAARTRLEKWADSVSRTAEVIWVRNAAKQDSGPMSVFISDTIHKPLSASSLQP